jgi:hypothetical protein
MFNLYLTEEKMKITEMKLIAYLIISVILIGMSCSQNKKEVERPEKILSKREVVYDSETYNKLSQLWQKYYDEYPSEDAYANWMYAARYASLPEYENLLKEGLDKYPSNPTILYLASMIKHGAHDNLEGVHLLEKAIELDPTYTDPLFSLAINYMDMKDEEKLDLALRKLLESGAISDEIIDYSYNMLASLEKDAILITNGDNDTYPGWILTRIIEYRPDVKIVNRSLLNTDWYPIYLIETGSPNFVTKKELNELRDNIWEAIKSEKIQMPPTGPYSDTLITKLVKAAEREGKPVYLAATLYLSGPIKKYWDSGRKLGLVTIVNAPEETYNYQISNITNIWLNEFRTSGIDSWKIKYAKTGDAGKLLMLNYPAGLLKLLDSIGKYAPEKTLPLFNWYREHLEPLIPIENLSDMNKMWCTFQDVPEINRWCKQMGYSE